MTISWPSDLPQLLNGSGYNESLVGDGLVETQPETGPPQTRRRTTTMPRMVSGQMILDSTQLESLRTFVRDTLIGGALAFSFPAQTGSDGTWLVKFPKGSLPQAGSLGVGNFMVQISLMVLP